MSLFDTVCKTNIDLANRLRVVATEYKTLYVMGCFGAPMTQKNKDRYCTNHSYNEQAARTAMIKSATEDTFGFDCVCLIKGILWGWNYPIPCTTALQHCPVIDLGVAVRSMWSWLEC